MSATEPNRDAIAKSAGGVGVWDWNLETNEMYVDPQLKAILGYADEEIRNHIDDWGQHVHPDDAPAVEDQVNAHLEGVTPHFEAIRRMLHKDGSIKWFLARGGAIRDASGRATRMVGSDMEITEQQLLREESLQAGEALRQTEGRLEAITAAVPDLVLILDEDGRYVDVLTTERGLLFADPEQLKGRLIHELLPEETAEMCLETIRRTIETGSPQNVEYDLAVQAGPRWFDGRTSPLPAIPGEKRSVIWVARDITERKQMEDVLRAGEERYRHLYTKTPAMLHSIDNNLEIISVSDRWLAVLGYERSQVIGRKSVEFLTEESRQYARAVAIPELLKTGFAKDVPLQFLKKNGEIIDILLSATIELNAEGNMIRSLAILTDVTERKRLEQELIRTQRLRALAEMVAGVSHNLNNMLSTVLGPAQLVKRLTSDPLILREIDEIVSSARRARDLVRRLNKPTGEAESLRPIPVNRIVSATVQATRPRWKDEAEAEGVYVSVLTRLDDEALIRGTEGGLVDIVTNLIFNAVDAMPNGGTLSISTHVEALEVSLTFTDTGTGMEELTRSRLFEPFFTTKTEVGRGLGLFTVRNEVEAWGGRLDVESQPHVGTTFRIHFPVASNHAAVEGVESTQPVETPRTGRILIVEDDAGVGDVLRRTLEPFHDVDVSLDPRAALKDFVPGSWDVAFIDLGLPGMAGDELSLEMSASDPTIATVLVTGWTLPEDDARLSAFDFHTRKPIDDVPLILDLAARGIELHEHRAAKR